MKKTNKMFKPPPTRQSNRIIAAGGSKIKNQTTTEKTITISESRNDDEEEINEYQEVNSKTMKKTKQLETDKRNVVKIKPLDPVSDYTDNQRRKERKRKQPNKDEENNSRPKKKGKKVIIRSKKAIDEHVEVKSVKGKMVVSVVKMNRDEELKHFKSKSIKEMRDCLNDILAKSKEMIVRTDGKLKIALSTYPDDEEINQLLEERNTLYKESYNKGYKLVEDSFEGYVNEHFSDKGEKDDGKEKDGDIADEKDEKNDGNEKDGDIGDEDDKDDGKDDDTYTVEGKGGDIGHEDDDNQKYGDDDVANDDNDKDGDGNEHSKKMVADSELLNHLHNVLKSSDLDTVTPINVRQRLEKQLDVDLTDKKNYIWKQIHLYLQSIYTHGNEDFERLGSEDDDVDGYKGNEDGFNK